MKITATAYEVYRRADGRSLACYVRPADDLYKAVIVQSEPGERPEDVVTLNRWPSGDGSLEGSGASVEMTYVRTSFNDAVKVVEEYAERWRKDIVKHASLVPFRAICGADVPNQQTASVEGATGGDWKVVTCGTCREVFLYTREQKCEPDAK